MSADRPSPGILWHQAGGDSARYRELMREHGHILAPGDEGYEQASRTLPCGYPGPQKPAAEWCEKFDMPASGCSHCRGITEEVPEEHDKTTLGSPFAARYPGRCAWGDERIEEGDTIRRDGDRGYVCAGCSA